MSDEAETLLDVARSTADLGVINDILDSHWRCFSGDTCSICEYFEEESIDDLLVEMSKNKNLSDGLQARVFEAACLWQGRNIGVLLTLASNPVISDELKQLSLDCDFWYGTGEGHEIVNGFLDVAEENSRYTPQDLLDFQEVCTREYEFHRENQ